MNILIAVGEKKLSNSIKRSIESNGYTATQCNNGIDALTQTITGLYDLIIIDQKLPEKNGLEVVLELRNAGNQAPVFIVSANYEISDIVAGLNAGADAYLAKPVDLPELQARIRVISRHNKQNKGASIRVADLLIDPVNHRVWRADTEIVFTTKEYQVLIYFVKNAGKLLSRHEIAANCWDEEVGTFSNIIDVYINYLRKKVDSDFSHKFFETVRGKGYIFKVEP